jgi:mono/diheme cytochrome c family protein
MYRDAINLTLSAASDGRVDSLIRWGSKGKMPAFSGTLSEEEIKAAEAYVMTLRKATPM